jgi:hypothetical protein
MNKQGNMAIFHFLSGLLMLFFLSACQNQSDPISLTSTTFPYSAESSTVVPTETGMVLSTKAPEEYLVIWGRETWPDGACMVWIVNPDSQKMIRTPVGTPWCNFDVLTVFEKQNLVSFPLHHQQSKEGVQSSKITVYELNQDRILHVKETISLQGLRLTSAPQWGSDDTIYFSAINNGHESIYRYDENTQVAAPYIIAENGFATAPVISSDGDYIAYEVWEDHENKAHNSRDDCGQLTCFSRFLHVWDVGSNTDTNLKPLIEQLVAGEPFYLHCEPEWSRTDNLLAFNVGCGLQTPGSVVVVDFSRDNVDVPVVINSVDRTRGVSKFRWSEGNRLILYGTAQIFGQNAVEDGYLVYLANEKALEKMAGLPERNKYDYDLIYFSDWTSDAEFAVGQSQIPGEVRTVNVVIANSWDSSRLESYVSSPNMVIADLKWSPTNVYIAYHTYNREDESRFIIMKNGSTVFDSEMIQVVFPRFQWYVQP